MDNRYLFRGKDRDTGAWCVGDLSHVGHKRYIDTTPTDGGKYNSRVNPNTIGQATGLYAAKSYRGESEADRLIFEHDILKRTQHHTKLGDCSAQYVVEWDEKQLGFGILYLIAEHETLEIIGTIHDTKEGDNNGVD